MTIALLTDIHGNREALSACLAHAGREGATRFVVLGDIIGYGADPEWCLDAVMELAGQGAVAILGNHDQAAFRPQASPMSGRAAAAMDWTRPRLARRHLDFLEALPPRHEEGELLFVHADASSPLKWRYVTDAEAARRSLGATPARITFCGHTHLPALFGLTATNALSTFTPSAGAPVPLARPRRWLAVMGSVGQPRDGDPAACYGLFDPTDAALRWMRVPYDVEAAAGKIRAAGLPDSLATRLAAGI